jgi:hypothetical protein
LLKLSELAEKIDARIFTYPDLAESIGIERYYAGDRMSELLNEASSYTLLVSNLSNPHLLRVAVLLDAPCICLLNGAEPNLDLVNTALENGKVLMVSPTDMAETCHRLSSLPLTCVKRVSK